MGRIARWCVKIGKPDRVSVKIRPGEREFLAGEQPLSGHLRRMRIWIAAAADFTNLHATLPAFRFSRVEK